MKLKPEEMQQIIREVEETKVSALKRYMERLENEAVAEYHHSDWGCRD